MNVLVPGQRAKFAHHAVALGGIAPDQGDFPTQFGQLARRDFADAIGRARNDNILALQSHDLIPLFEQRTPDAYRLRAGNFCANAGSISTNLKQLMVYLVQSIKKSRNRLS
jgi:hypothetical protein